MPLRLHSLQAHNAIRIALLLSRCGLLGHVDAFYMGEADEFHAAGVSGEDERGVVTPQRGVVGMFDVILAAVHHANGERGGAVQDVADVVEGHGSR